MRTLLLVHGAWCGEWVFWRLAPELARRGVPYQLTDLPSCRTGDATVDARDDAAYLRSRIDAIDGPVVVAGKSYGGAVISGACVGHPKVAHLVYIAALMPEAGEPIQSAIAGALTPAFAAGVRPLADGRIEMDAEIGARYAFAHASGEEQATWRRERRPMSIGDRKLAFDRVAWQSIPSTYVVCAQDEAILPAAQRDWARRASTVFERAFDHSPGVSKPGEVAELLASIAGA